MNVKYACFNLRSPDFIPVPIVTEKSSSFDEITESRTGVDFGLFGSGLVGNKGTFVVGVLGLDRFLFCSSTTSVDRGR